MSDPNAATVTAALLRQPAALAIRVIANARLDASVAALDQLDTGAPEALHDLRVSLRRLRSWLRTFQPYVDDTVRRRTLRRLKRAVRSTNAARDLEVWSEWLAEQSDLAARDRAGARYLAGCLATESQAAHEKALGRVQRRLPRITDALRKELSTYSLHVREGTDADREMSVAVADALRSAYRRLRRRAARIEELTDIEAIHATRIAAKKLRYVAETLELPEAADTAQALSELQDVLGTVHDMQLLVERLLDEIELAAGAEARRRARAKAGLEPDGRGGAAPHRAISGLTEIAVRAQRRAEDEFTRYTREWKGERLDVVGAAVASIADKLEGSVGSA